MGLFFVFSFVTIYEAFISVLDSFIIILTVFNLFLLFLLIFSEKGSFWGPILS